jgi:hypothetical protein
MVRLFILHGDSLQALLGYVTAPFFGRGLGRTTDAIFVDYGLIELD